MAQSTTRRWHLFGVQRSSRVPRYGLKRQPTRSPYRFFLVQASIRSSAFSMFSIELATLNRR